MARENIDLYNVGDDPEQIKQALIELRQDFDFHNHDGVNSPSLPQLEALSGFGDGSDGNVLINTGTSLSRDMFYNNLTIQKGQVLNPNGYRIFVKNIFTVNGTWARNGNNASGSTAGTALAAGTLPGSLAGVNGGSGGQGGGNINGGAATYAPATTDGASTNPSLGVSGQQGVEGGGPGAGSGFIGGGVPVGAAGTATATKNIPRNSFGAYLLADISGTTITQHQGSASSSGSHGGDGGYGASDANGGNGGMGGGSGGQGGIIQVFARIIINNGTISANGGNGGNATNGANAPSSTGSACGGGGGGGGGDGGQGGVVFLVYSKYYGNGTITANGGTGGNFGTGGTGLNGGGTGGTGQTGLTGVAGKIIRLTDIANQKTSLPA